MKNIGLLAVAIIATACSMAVATPFVNVDVRLASDLDIYSVHLDTGDLDDQFNSIRVVITPDSRPFVDFVPGGLDGFVPLGPSDDATFTNASLTLPTPLGLGFSTVGDQDDSENGFSYTTGPLGANISSAVPIFLNNVVLPAGGTATAMVELIDTGAVIRELPFFLACYDCRHDPVVSSPADGSTISLRPAVEDETGLLDDAIALTTSSGGTLEIVEVSILNDDFGIFGATADGLNIDLTIDVPAAAQLPASAMAYADLLVETNGGNLSYTLVYIIPEPGGVILISLGCVGFLSTRGSGINARRKGLLR